MTPRLLVFFALLGCFCVACADSFETSDASVDSDVPDSPAAKTLCRTSSSPCDVPLSGAGCPEMQPSSGTSCSGSIECVYCDEGDFFSFGDVMACDGSRFSMNGSIACTAE